MTAKSLKRGDEVRWQTSQGETEGKVVRKVTGTEMIKHNTVHASKSDPQYRVRSAKTGAEAIHKPESLKKK